MNLLDACLNASGFTGGTIHEYLPRLKWERYYQGGDWYLWLDRDVKNGKAGKTLAYSDNSYRKSDLPKIEPAMSPETSRAWFKWL